MKVRELNGCEYWYDPSCRVWFAARVDKEGNLGPSIDAATRGEIEDLIKRGSCHPHEEEA